MLRQKWDKMCHWKTGRQFFLLGLERFQSSCKRVVKGLYLLGRLEQCDVCRWVSFGKEPCDVEYKKRFLQFFLHLQSTRKDLFAA